MRSSSRSWTLPPTIHRPARAAAFDSIEATGPSGAPPRRQEPPHEARYANSSGRIARSAPPSAASTRRRSTSSRLAPTSAPERIDTRRSAWGGSPGGGCRERGADAVERGRVLQARQVAGSPLPRPRRGSPDGRSSRSGSSAARRRRPPSRAGTTGRGGPPPRSGAVSEARSASTPGFVTTKHQIVSPSSGCGTPIAADSATEGCDASALSTSAGPSPCPPPTACRRSAPWRNQNPSSSRVAQSPCAPDAGERRQ